MKHYTFYMQKGDVKDATDFYVNIIREAIRENGNTSRIVYSIKEIEDDDIVVTIQAKAWLKVKILKPRHKTINWYQGIPPEEMKFLISNRIKCIIWCLLWTFFEMISLRYCDFNFFVSDAMRKHFKKKYGYNKNNYFLMPCFNELLDISMINEKHYEKPSFVYAGGLQKWQCFEQTLDFFVEIKKHLPGASLSIFTGSLENARSEMAKRGIDGDVKYVPYKELNKMMCKMKYGFLIREDNEVNNVATPTKMNSYLSAGIIPVYSSVICDFKEKLSNCKYIISGNSVKEITKGLIEMERKKVDIDEMRKEYNSIFSTYYSRNNYINRIREIEIFR